MRPRARPGAIQLRTGSRPGPRFRCRLSSSLAGLPDSRLEPTTAPTIAPKTRPVTATYGVAAAGRPTAARIVTHGASPDYATHPGPPTPGNPPPLHPPTPPLVDLDPAGRPASHGPGASGAAKGRGVGDDAECRAGRKRVDVLLGPLASGGDRATPPWTDSTRTKALRRRWLPLGITSAAPS